MQKAVLARAINRAVSPLGIRIARSHDWGDPKQFLPFQETLAAAAEAGLSVADYVDVEHNVKGATQDTIDRMADLGVFSGPIETVVEIGPGSGRYLEKVVRKCSPSRYEIYETAELWADYLVDTYDIVRQTPDGCSLSATPAASADLVQAHKVFVVTPFVVTCRYWKEMLRVTRPNAHIVFDVVTEDCMDPETLQRWIDAGIDHGNYPAIVPKEYAKNFFTSQGAAFVGSFFIPMRPGKTEVLVFRKVQH